MSRHGELEHPGRTLLLNPADALVVTFVGMLTVADLLLATRAERPASFAWLNLAVIALVVGIAWAHNRTRSKAVAYVHDWYVAPLLYGIYRETCDLVHLAYGSRLYDSALIRADRLLFRTDPVAWMQVVANPWLTEILQIAYTLFYILFLGVGFEHYRARTLRLYQQFMFLCAYGFVLSYLAYFTFPAVGPRFTLYDFRSIDVDLPGIWLTPALRWFINVGGDVPPGASNAVAMAAADRDVFPSGHTMMSIVLIWWVLRHQMKVRYFIVTAATLTIVGTIYLRYHYAVDLVAGGVLALACVASWRRLYQAIESRLTDEVKCYR